MTSLISVKLLGLLWLVKGWGGWTGSKSSFLGKGNRNERVKLPRKPIYAKGRMLTGLQARAKDLNYKCTDFAAQSGISALPNGVLSVLPTESVNENRGA